MSEILDAMEQLYALEETLSITSPIAASVQKAWPYTPPSSQVITDTPAFVHSVTIPELVIGPAILREQFEVNMRLVVYDPSSERAAKIALAFWPAIRTMLSQNVKLGLSGWSIGSFGGAKPTLTTFRDQEEVAGKTFIGLDLSLTLYHHIGSNNAPGDPP